MTFCKNVFPDGNRPDPYRYGNSDPRDPYHNLSSTSWQVQVAPHGSYPMEQQYFWTGL